MTSLSESLYTLSPAAAPVVANIVIPDATSSPLLSVSILGVLSSLAIALYRIYREGEAKDLKAKLSEREQDIVDLKSQLEQANRREHDARNLANAQSLVIRRYEMLHPLPVPSPAPEAPHAG